MLSPTTGYAALALALLARAEGQSVRVRYIAERCGIPGPYLSKIIHTMSRAGLVGTKRGAGGGAWLIADPDELTLLTLCKLLDDPVLERSCLLGLPVCRPERGCAAHDFCQTQREALANYLARTTLKDFSRQTFGEEAVEDAHPPPTERRGPRVIRTSRNGERGPDDETGHAEEPA